MTLSLANINQHVCKIPFAIKQQFASKGNIKWEQKV